MKTKKAALGNAALICIIVLFLFSGSAAASVRSGLMPGYLPVEEHPNSLALLPPPPAPGSAAFALDEDVARRTFAVRGTPRFAQALTSAQGELSDGGRFHAQKWRSLRRL